MPFPIINSIASWVLKQRIHQIELFLKYPHEVQNELLMNLIRSCEETVVGKKHDFESIKNYTTFKEFIPLSSRETSIFVLKVRDKFQYLSSKFESKNPYNYTWYKYQV